ncbi:aspartate 1-decarboxylase [Sporosarcina trichiuri]|uniref:aspartate 1-decarboxylase n=1 Tax=Sporosarcina trichiuri TaxID=3056445 RepID=UPI0025B4A8AC|nr:aspartate 1-decarboxylase [Sporosarcina sp. 0.2-SM1T-5]WJY28572.1 aspartate 1-decarboxylase [Sporosarcina sp. 0.2-SM1T-5]
MYRTMLTSKLHRAVVTEANLNYVGSITIDADLLDAASILPNEKVQIVNNNNGERFETYTIAGTRGSGMICVNGAAARLVQPGDVIIILAYALMADDDAKHHIPTVLLMDENNRITETIKELPQMTV